MGFEKTCVARMLKNCEKMLREPPKKEWLTLLDKDDHPELDLSPELDVDDIKKHQLLIGALQWAVSTGRFDIAAHVMTLGRHRVDAIANSSMQHVKKLVMQLTGAWNAIASSKCCLLTSFPCLNNGCARACH